MKQNKNWRYVTKVSYVRRIISNKCVLSPWNLFSCCILKSSVTLNLFQSIKRIFWVTASFKSLYFGVCRLEILWALEMSSTPKERSHKSKDHHIVGPGDISETRNEFFRNKIRKKLSTTSPYEVWLYFAETTH